MSTKPFKRTWPRVVRSPEIDEGTMLAIDGVNFQDGLRRIVVGMDMLPEGVNLIKAVLIQIDSSDQQRSWFEAVLDGDVSTPNHPIGGEV